MIDYKKEVKKEIRLAGIVEESIVDGPGIRFVVFVQGCPHICEGCHNKGSQDFGGGFDADIDLLAKKIIESRTSRITLSGGEPFCKAGDLVTLLNKVKKKKVINVLAYSGYTIDELFEFAENDRDIKNLLSNVNYLVDGRYMSEKKSMDSFYRGSSNQNIYDITCYPNSKKIKLVKSKEEID